MQRERSPGQTSKPLEPLLDARVAMRSDLDSEHKLTLTLAASESGEGSERLDRRREALNESIAKDVEKRQQAGELTAPQESKDVPIPFDSDPRRRRAMKAATAVASSGSSQMEGSRAVADESRIDVEGEERDEFRSSEAEHQETNKTKASMEESQMDDEGKERDESRSSTEPNTRRRITTKTSLEEGESDERAVAVITQGSSDGIREKAMRIASIDELETGSSTARWSSPGSE